MPVFTVPKVVTPSSYYKPSMTSSHTINLMPSASKALS